MAIPKKYHISSLGLKETFCRDSINTFICRCKYQSTCRFYSMLKLGLGHFVILQDEHTFWNCSTFLRKHRKLSNYYKNNSHYYTSLIGAVTNQEPRKTIGYCFENNRLYCFPNPRWRRLFSANQEVN